MKKKIVIVLAVIMLLNLIAGTVFAAEGEDSLVDTTVKVEVLDPGDTRKLATFHVTDELGAEVMNASVYMQGTGALTDTLLGVTGVDGKVDIRFFDGDHTCIVKKAGYEDVVETFTMAGTNLTREIQLQKANDVVFTVKDEGGNALSGATVTINGKQQQTNTDGVAAFRIADGTHSYTVTGSGYVAETGDITVAGDTQKDVVLKAAQRVQFSVTNDSSHTVEGATVTVDGQDYVTDANGSAEAWMLSGSYSYTAKHSLHDDKAGSFTVRFGTTQVPIQMAQKRYTADFLVTDTQNIPLKDAVVSMNAQAARTNGSGRAKVISILPGTYNYTIHANGYTDKTGVAIVDTQDIALTEMMESAPVPTPTPTPSEVPTPTPSETPSSSPSEVPPPSASPSSSPSATPTIGASASASVSTSSNPSPNASVSLGVAQPSGTAQSSAERMDVGVNVKYADGTPVKNMTVELHSTIYVARTDDKGWALFEKVEPGDHSVYVKNDAGAVVGSTTFHLEYGDKTDLTVSPDGAVRVSMNVQAVNVALEVEIDEQTGMCDIKAVREGCVPDGLSPAAKKEQPDALGEVPQNSLINYMVIGLVAIGGIIVAILLIRLLLKHRKEKQENHDKGDDTAQ